MPWFFVYVFFVKIDLAGKDTRYRRKNAASKNVLLIPEHLFSSSQDQGHGGAICQAADYLYIRDASITGNGYGDASPEFAASEDMAQIYGRTLTGMKIFDQEAFKDPNWEYVTGVTGSPASYKLDGSASVLMSLLRAKGITTPTAA
ncbi:MAG: hypothetical protein IIY77_07855 [Lachnospiraceae bacterium]|nr:hypothetical protein [Lachnospiraceae bacterium]